MCLSPLKSHKKSHQFQDTPNDTCICSGDAETTCHFLLHCANFITHRKTLFDTLNPILRANNILFLVDIKLVNLLLYGDGKLKLKENQDILNATISFIRNTRRFSRT